MTLRTLALETSGFSGSVAACDGARLLAERDLPAEQRSAQSLAGAIERLLAEVGWQPRQVERVAVSVGPGSFTGLRVGVTTAKTFAYAVDAVVIGVDTLEVIAAQAPPEAPRLATAIDAGRQELFAALYARETDERHALVEPGQIVKIDTWLASLAAGTWASGPALDKLAVHLPPDVACAPRQAWQPRASTVGRVGDMVWEQGGRDDIWQLVPKYLRRSAAEEKWDRKTI